MKDASRRSERAGGALLGLCAAALLLAAAARPGAQDSPRFDGEFGLWVRAQEDSLVVSWIQVRPGPGTLLVLDERGHVLHQVVTPARIAHRAALPRPRQDRVRLQYGPPGTLHETAIELRAPRRPAVTHLGVDSLLIFGDVHGEYDRVIELLRNAGYIDAELRWKAGRSHLAFVGDITDRGSDVLATLWLIYRLEHEAAAAGGRVHLVLGNHELMVMMNDVRYVSQKEQQVALQHGVEYYRLFDPRSSILGRWLVSKPAVIRIDNLLLAHGGVAPEYTSYTIRGIDETFAKITRGDLFYFWGDSTAHVTVDEATMARQLEFLEGSRSIFWYRGYAQSDSLGAELEYVLHHFGAAVHVIGHTPFARITERYNGQLIATNTERYADEALLMVRHGGGYDRFRVRAEGSPRRLGEDLE